MSAVSNNFHNEGRQQVSVPNISHTEPPTSPKKVPSEKCQARLPGEVANNIINAVQRAQQNQLLTESDQASLIRRIERVMNKHAQRRDNVAARIARSWTFLQYSLVCILVHHFKVPVLGPLGVYNYSRNNPFFMQKGKDGSYRGAAKHTEGTFRDYCWRIEHGGATSTKFPKMQQWLGRFTEGQKQACKIQYDSWKKSPNDKSVRSRENMPWKIWCPLASSKWDPNLERWVGEEHKNGRATQEPPHAKGDQQTNDPRTQMPSNGANSLGAAPQVPKPQQNMVGTGPHVQTQPKLGTAGQGAAPPFRPQPKPAEVNHGAARPPQPQPKFGGNNEAKSAQPQPFPHFGNRKGLDSKLALLPMIVPNNSGTIPQAPTLPKFGGNDGKTASQFPRTQPAEGSRQGKIQPPKQTGRIRKLFKF